MVPEFEAAAFRMQPAERSSPIRTPYGYHLIEVLEREGNRVRARHILRSAKPTDEDKQKAAAMLVDLKKRIGAGESFAEVARQYSEDAEGAPKGGDLGWFSERELAVPEFLNTIKKLRVGEVSDAIETQYGMHLLWLEDRQESHPLSLDADFAYLENMALNYKRLQEFNQWLSGIKRNFYIEFKEEL